MNRKRVVLAGNYSEFLEHCRFMAIDPKRDAIFINSQEKVRGFECHEDEVYEVGTFDRLPDARDIRIRVQQRCRIK